LRTVNITAVASLLDVKVVKVYSRGMPWFLTEDGQIYELNPNGELVTKAAISFPEDESEDLPSPHPEEASPLQEDTAQRFETGRIPLPSPIVLQRALLI